MLRISFFFCIVHFGNLGFFLKFWHTSQEFQLLFTPFPREQKAMTNGCIVFKAWLVIKINCLSLFMISRLVVT